MGEISLTQSYELSDFPVGGVKDTYDEIQNLLKGKGWNSVIQGTTEDDSGIRSVNVIKPKNLGSVTSLQNGLLGLEFNLHQSKVSKNGSSKLTDHVFILIDNYRGEGGVHIYIGASTVTLCKEICLAFEKNLNLTMRGDRYETIPKTDTAECGVSYSSSSVKQVANISENSRSEAQNSIKSPQKITLKWLWEHAPIAMWAWLVGIFLAVFALGLRLGELQWFTGFWKLVSG